ncbi:alpha-tubulin suppressor protein aats1 [Lichtheimia corymbifera JMRC:FSU:9682]|uniref:Alpha-tubulin suppressor protein aats1 n=1 Tax=Lichtheimia corymbifera JMRC:FSU:9682 TaxID=1263082 RepID=A0A068RP60_9FUNG|nr:alpha-tubulin suppressor protein aats1 [Lichtheimia corymbifera JMRC:FSU:9682]
MTILYAFGSNGNGQLGVGHTDDINTPTPCIGIPDTETIVKVVGGGNHTAVLTQTGRVFLAGQWHTSNDMTTTTFIEPECVQGRQWQDVACGWSFTILIERESGLAYGFGTARSGELGSMTKDPGLVAINTVPPLAMVDCGWRHVVGLGRDDGCVYGWGWDRHGQLLKRINVKPHIQQPNALLSANSTPSKIRQITCGHLFTALLTEDGTVYGFGSNKYAQLGDIEQQHQGDDLIKIDKGVSFISTGWHHIAMAKPDSDGHGLVSIHNKGRNDHGQMAGQDHSMQVDHFVCGSEHMLALKQGKVFAWGWNEHGNCTSTQEDVLQPIEVQLPKQGTVTIIGAGCATSWIGLA